MKYFGWFLLVGTLFLASACVDDDFDTPTPIPVPEANATVAELKALFDGSTQRIITEDIVVEATVISSDEAGNIFETLYIQDETGGLALRIDANDLFNDFPYLSTVVIDAKDLFLSEFAELIQLDGMNEANFKQHVFFKSRETDLVIPTKSLGDLSFNDVPSIVRLENIEFSSADIGGNYGDGSTFSGVNRNFRDCNGNEIITRISNFGDFASTPIAEGNGSGTFVVSRFRDDLQLLFGSLDDLQFDGQRCGQTGGGDIIPIADLRAQWTAGTSDIADGTSIEGMVISDFENENITGRNLVIQDESGAGIVLRFGDFHAFGLGEVISVAVGGRELSEFNGLLQISDLSIDNARRTTTSISVEPNVVTVGEILADFENFESTLVRVNGAMLSGGSTLNNGNQGIDVNDGTGTITLFTTSFASFANSAVPAMADVIAFVSQGGNSSEMQLSIRTLSDLIGERPDAVEEFFEDFQTAPDRMDVTINGWSTVTVEGDRSWWAREFESNMYAQATAFNASANEIETWMVSPEFDHTVDKVLQFESAQAFYAHDGLSVWISTDYDGSSISSANFTPLTSAVLAGSTSADNEWIDSGEIDLAATGGTAHIAFRYEGNPNNATTSYRIDNVSLMNK